MRVPERARIVVVGLGGTIAMTRDANGGATPRLSPEQLVAAVPGLAATGIAVETESFRNRPGAALTFDDLLGLAGRCRELLDGGAGGIVVTQGTDTIEETAYLLDLLHPGDAPIVVTGAMRNPGLAGADGPANLLAAVQTAAHPDARGLGCLVVFADEIHAAARVRKTHSTSPGTFASPDGGPLGHVVEGLPTLLARPPARHVLPGTGPGRPRVGLYTAALGDDGDLLRDLAPRLDGLVVAAFGAGHVPDTWLDVLTGLAGRIPVVLASRTGAGPVLQATYGFPGSERDLIARGLIPAGLLHPHKARVLLHLLLTLGPDAATVAAAVRAAGAVEPVPTWPWSTGRR